MWKINSSRRVLVRPLYPPSIVNSDEGWEDPTVREEASRWDLSLENLRLISCICIRRWIQVKKNWAGVQVSCQGISVELNMNTGGQTLDYSTKNWNLNGAFFGSPCIAWHEINVHFFLLYELCYYCSTVQCNYGRLEGAYVVLTPNSLRTQLVQIYKRLHNVGAYCPCYTRFTRIFSGAALTFSHTHALSYVRASPSLNFCCR